MVGFQGTYFDQAQAWTARVTENLSNQAEDLKQQFAGRETVSHSTYPFATVWPAHEL